MLRHLDVGHDDLAHHLPGGSGRVRRAAHRVGLDGNIDRVAEAPWPMRRVGGPFRQTHRSSPPAGSATGYRGRRLGGPDQAIARKRGGAGVAHAAIGEHAHRSAGVAVGARLHGATDEPQRQAIAMFDVDLSPMPTPVPGDPESRCKILKAE
jgi:hypothetical protein